MKIGITGSTGSIGVKLKEKFNLSQICLFKNKIENKECVDKWIKFNNFDIIFHLAAIVPIKLVEKNKNKAYKVNVEGTKNLITAINKFSKKKIWFFYASTSHVYPFSKNRHSELSLTNPINYYGKTKLLSEKYILKNKNKIVPCIGRIFSFTSEKQNTNYFIPSIIKKLKSKKNKIEIKNVNHERDFLTIDDIISAILFLKRKKATGIFNICSGKKINLIKIIDVLNLKFKKEIKINKNIYKTILHGSNKKLINLGWKISHKNYINFLFKNQKK